MLCPFCNAKDSRVLESRVAGENSVRRRRQCESCNRRFTTYERVEVMQLLVIKRSGSREPYTREKLRAGVSRACSKTTITAEQIDDLVDSVENELAADGKREVTAADLGEIALAKLRNLDQVAYVRFASVYRQFRSIEDFVAELHTLTGQGDPGSSAGESERITATISSTVDHKPGQRS
ncbi:MAG: transcriptional repressor NrdR [Candidatus Melainabacteria bacterium]|nr:transcriptional repressor NrdR [Candidatus Melainabacteria bacterium]